MMQNDDDIFPPLQGLPRRDAPPQGAPQQPDEGLNEADARQMVERMRRQREERMRQQHGDNGMPPPPPRNGGLPPAGPVVMDQPGRPPQGRPGMQQRQDNGRQTPPGRPEPPQEPRNGREPGDRPPQEWQQPQPREERPRQPVPQQRRPRDEDEVLESPVVRIPEVPRAARRNDPRADPRDRRGKLIGDRGFIDPEKAEAGEGTVWLVLGFILFLNSWITTILGVGKLWREVADLTPEQPTPWFSYLLGLGLGIAFIYGQMGLAPGIWRRVRRHAPILVENLLLYIICVLPDTISTGLFHWFTWVYKIFDHAFGGGATVFWLSFALCSVIALASSMFPLLAVIRREGQSAR